MSPARPDPHTRHTNNSTARQYSRLYRLAILAVLGLSGCATQAPQTQLAFEVSELSSTIRPQDNFWGYVNQNWIDSTDIPADRSSYGTFYQLIDRTEAQIKAILEELAATAEASSTDQDAQTVSLLFQSFLDQARLEELGLTPLQPWFEKIDAIDDYTTLQHHFGEFAALNVVSPVLFYADNDAGDAQRLLIYLWQGGLGLPNRDYYLKDTAKLVTARQQYQQHIENMFALAGWPNGAQAAAQIVALESKIAELHWSPVQNRDRQTIYSNQYNRQEAHTLLSGFNLDAWFQGMGMDTPDKLVIAQTDYFANLHPLIHNTPLAQWRAYLKFHLLAGFASYLTQDINAERFDFAGKKLRGQEQQAPRWKRGVRLINRSVGELLGKIYVAQHFDDQAKDQINQMVENLRQAFAVSIKQLEWMSTPTKAQALAKLDAFLPKLGYPDRWRDFSGLTLVADTLVHNVIKVRQFNHAYELTQLNQPVDRSRWTTNPQTVNAFYRPTHNSITFPAGILQTPMFDPANDPAMNYGAIGSIIGHEFSHGFDDQGRKFDGNGLLRNWWTDADAEQYGQRAAVIVEQYNNFQPLPDASINGQLTLGENIGDLAGVTMAYRAFELSGLADGPEVAGLTPSQRFFVGYALAFRGKIREPYLRELLLRDPHSPGEYRVTGVLRNVPAFYAAFDVGPQDGMYLPPEQRAKIW